MDTLVIRADEMLKLVKSTVEVTLANAQKKHEAWAASDSLVKEERMEYWQGQIDALKAVMHMERTIGL